MRIKFLQNFYFSLVLILFLIIILTPKLVNDGFPLADEEMTEIIIITSALVLSRVTFHLYRREAEKNKDKLDSLVNHIGQINVQVENLKSIFSDIEKYPENKSDLRNILKLSGQKVLGIVNADWVLFRIIETDTHRSIIEQYQARQGTNPPTKKISNKMLINNEPIRGLTITASNQKNLNVKAFCIIPNKNISEHQQILITSIINSLGMLYIIFDSKYYRKNNH